MCLSVEEYTTTKLSSSDLTMQREREREREREGWGAESRCKYILDECLFVSNLLNFYCLMIGSLSSLSGLASVG